MFEAPYLLSSGKMPHQIAHVVDWMADKHLPKMLARDTLCATSRIFWTPTDAQLNGARYYQLSPIFSEVSMKSDGAWLYESLCKTSWGTLASLLGFGVLPPAPRQLAHILRTLANLWPSIESLEHRVFDKVIHAGEVLPILCPGLVRAWADPSLAPVPMLHGIASVVEATTLAVIERKARQRMQQLGYEDARIDAFLDRCGDGRKPHLVTCHSETYLLALGPVVLK